MKAPDYISPIVGYRVWQWDPAGLKSLNGELWFPHQPLAAGCRASALGTMGGCDEAAHDAHEAPQANCTCGVYAAKNLEHLHKAGYSQYGIHGEVNLWGTVVEHTLGWRSQFAYPKTLFLPQDALPFTFAAIQSRLKTLIAYHADIFVADPKGNIPLWASDSGYDAAGLDYLIEMGKQYYERRRHERTLEKGDRVAVLGRGIAVVEQVDDKRVHAVQWNSIMLRLRRKDIVWNQQNIRWEVEVLAPSGQHRRVASCRTPSSIQGRSFQLPDC
jgi:hypothetical protein